ncbi:hypothetical protein HDU93_009652 [Gonapodya sp. JEL0774]|nr:hypothetical protein HDU93_009652 [Gonapodya sp. JEL0774]
MRTGIDIKRLHILDGQQYCVQRFDGLSDKPGYNFLTKHHIVTNLETGQPWRFAVLPWERKSFGPGPRVRPVSLGFESVTGVYRHEKKRYHPERDPAQDDLAFPLLRRSDNEVIEEFRRYEDQRLYCKDVTRVQVAFEAEIAVYYKVPEPGEVEVWTAKDIEELTFRGIERVSGRHMLCGIRHVMLHHAPPEHIPTIVLHLRNMCDFKSFGKVWAIAANREVPNNSCDLWTLASSSSSRHSLDRRVTNEMWDKVIPEEIGADDWT